MEKKNMLDERNSPMLWTREGFIGATAAVLRSAYTPDYLSATGPHSPRRAVVGKMTPKDASSADELATVIATSRSGLSMSVSGRKHPMSFAVRNVECDELHFIQSGDVIFDTEFGELKAEPGDFVVIPRAIAYKYRPASGDMRSIIMESPWAIKVNAPFGVIPPGAITRAVVQPANKPAEKTVLMLKALDGVTKLALAYDPTSVIAHVMGESPVWKVNLAKIQVGTYAPIGGAPVQFTTTDNNEFCVFNLSARVTKRPPVHLNADYDEIIVYAAGPGAWGSCTEPGIITHVPKGVPHQGPEEEVAEGYLAWLVECRATMRWTEEGLKASEPMETCEYGPLGT